MKAIIKNDPDFTEVALVPETEEDRELAAELVEIKALRISWTLHERLLRKVHTVYQVEVNTAAGLKTIEVRPEWRG
jgi:hypothetical protein